MAPQPMLRKKRAVQAHHQSIQKISATEDTELTEDRASLASEARRPEHTSVYSVISAANPTAL
ncbi:hypothetical protein, partial [Rhodopirellula bahusiensis]